MVSKARRTPVAVIPVRAGVSAGTPGFGPEAWSGFGEEVRRPVQLCSACDSCRLQEGRKSQLKVMARGSKQDW
jgi:hypothetical protein